MKDTVIATINIESMRIKGNLEEEIRNIIIIRLSQGGIMDIITSYMMKLMIERDSVVFEAQEIYDLFLDLFIVFRYLVELFGYECFKITFFFIIKRLF